MAQRNGLATLACCVLGAVVAATACGSSDGKHEQIAAAGASGDTGRNPLAGGAGGDEGGVAGDAGMPSFGAASDQAGAGGVAASSSGGDNGAGQAGQAGEGTPCSGREPFCSTETTLSWCSNGFQAGFECTDGCSEDACSQTNLQTDWVLYNFAVPDDSGPVSSYSFSENGLSALETENALPSVYYLDRVVQDVDIKGNLSVETSSDDDFIGIVFGWQDPSHFYLLDWKKATQSDGNCGLANVGISLKLVSSDEVVSACHNFWDSAGTDQTTPLIATDANPTGWVANTVYEFHLSYKPGDIKLQVLDGETEVASLTSTDATYPSGKFGFYTYSQASTRFEFLQIAPAQ